MRRDALIDYVYTCDQLHLTPGWIGLDWLDPQLVCCSVYHAAKWRHQMPQNKIFENFCEIQ